MVRLQNASLTLSGVQILSDIVLSVRPGEVLAICGPNGAGKSTLMSLLAGDRQPDAGAALLDGAPIGSYAPLDLARRRAVMEQAPRTPVGFTARAVVALGAEVAPKAAVGSVDPIVENALVEGGVRHLADAPIATLSGGEAARVHFARVLAQLTAGRLDPAAGPGVLLLDEPTASLDLAHQAGLLACARRAAGAGSAVVAVLHDLNLAAAFADRVALLESGRLVAVDAPEAALTTAQLSEIYGVSVLVERGGAGALRVAPDFSAFRA